MPKKEEVKEEVKAEELQPKPDCPICHGAGVVVLVPDTKIQVGCTCKYK